MVKIFDKDGRELQWEKLKEYEAPVESDESRKAREAVVEAAKFYAAEREWYLQSFGIINTGINGRGTRLAFIYIMEVICQKKPGS